MTREKLKELQEELADLDEIEADYRKDLEELQSYRDSGPEDGPSRAKFDQDIVEAQSGLGALNLKRRELLQKIGRLERTINEADVNENWYTEPEPDEPRR